MKTLKTFLRMLALGFIVGLSFARGKSVSRPPHVEQDEVVSVPSSSHAERDDAISSWIMAIAAIIGMFTGIGVLVTLYAAWTYAPLAGAHVATEMVACNGPGETAVVHEFYGYTECASSSSQGLSTAGPLVCEREDVWYGFGYDLGCQRGNFDFGECPGLDSCGPRQEREHWGSEDSATDTPPDIDELWPPRPPKVVPDFTPPDNDTLTA